MASAVARGASLPVPLDEIASIVGKAILDILLVDVESQVGPSLSTVLMFLSSSKIAPIAWLKSNCVRGFILSKADADTCVITRERDYSPWRRRSWPQDEQCIGSSRWRAIRDRI